MPENAQTPTTMAPAFFAGDRVLALLGALIERQPRELKQAATAELTTLWHMTQTFAIVFRQAQQPTKSTTYQNTGQAKARANGKTDFAKA